jgi:molecular chaperone DnaK (HSP70)
MSFLSSRRDTNWIACIDFGTALSKAAMVAAIDSEELGMASIKPIYLVDMPGDRSFLLPSLIFVTDENVLFGREAEQAATRAEASGRRALVSPKQYLSTHDPEDFDAPLSPDIDPTGKFSAKHLLRLYLGHLLERIAHDAKKQNLPWPVPLRVARPAWKIQRADRGERTLKELVRDGFALVDELGPVLSTKGGVPHSVALRALARLKPMTPAQEKRIFELSNGTASVLEATAVAAGTVRATGRRVIAVADVGAGTSDFAAFMTGLPGRNILAEVKGSSRILHKAGDFLDGHLQRYILKKTGLPEDAPAARGLANRLRAKARRNKEILFSDGTLTVEVDDDSYLLEVTAQEFLADEHVTGFAQRLREEFHETLKIAIACAKKYSSHDGVPASVEILLTGGGHVLPMVRSLYESPSIAWTYRDAAPDLADRPEDIAFHSVCRQLAVAIGGAVRDLPPIIAAV